MSMERADYVIVGGGVYGAATAWHLARTGAEVLLLEREEVANGSSGGMGKRGVRANGRDIRELPLMRMAYDIWPSLSGELGAATGWEPVGHLQLYEEGHHGDAAAVRQRVQAEAGIETVHLDRGGVCDIEPGSSDVVLGALHCPRDGIADHTATTKAYMTRAREAGAILREGANVTSVVRSGDRVRAVELEGGEQIEVGRGLLLLANAGVADLVAGATGRELPVWTVFPQAIRTVPASAPPFGSLLGHAHRKLALKMLPDGAVMISGGWRGVRTPGTDRGATRPSAVAANVEEAIRIFPAIGDLDIRDAHADRAETTCIDGLPIISRLPEASNTWIGCGWTGHGWAIAPAVAPMLADWVLDGAVPDLLRPFGLDRFR